MNSRVVKALFLDRDGVINIDHGYVHKKEDFVFVDGLFETLRKIAKKGYIFIIVTNQSGIGRGYYSEEAFNKLSNFMISFFLKEGIEIAGLYYCPHKPEDSCNCRKPEAGMFLKAEKDFKIDMQNSWMIGDKESDMLAAKKAKIPNRVLLSTIKSANATHQIESITKLVELL